jgi:hypothetical protein
VYGVRDERATARELNRSVASVRNMAQTLYTQEPRSGPWSDEEVANLRQYLGGSNLEAICNILAREAEDVEAKIAELAQRKRTGPWSQDDLADFKRLYGTRADEDLAIIFGRRLEEIARLADELCIAKDKAFLRRHTGGKQATRMPRWSAEELDLLEQLYPQHSNLEIARQLNRSVKSVVSKAHNMGLKKDPARLREMGRQNVSLRYRKRDD